MFSHRTFQTQMPCVIEPLVTAAVSEMSRLLVQCSAMESLVEAAVTEMSSLLGRWLSLTQQNEQEESQVSLLLEGTRQLNKAMTSHFTSLMETWSKAAVGKISVLKLSMDEGESASAAKKRTRLDDTTTQKRVKPKTGWTGAPKEHEDQSEVDMDEDDALLQGEEDMWLDLARAAMAVPAPGKQPPVKRKRGRPPKNAPTKSGRVATAAPTDTAEDEETGGTQPPHATSTEPVSHLSEQDATTATIQKKKASMSPIQCPSCEKVFAKKCWFDRHFLSHSKPHLCSQCGKRFARLTGLIAHTRRHTGEKLFKCSVCGTQFSYKSTFNRHMRQHSYKKTKMRTHTCLFCEGQFEGVMALQRHECSALQKTFTCSLCPETFECRQRLADHENLHSGDKDFVCEVCGESFFSSSSLSTHRVTHELVLGGSDPSVLQNRHTGEKPFTCDVCGKGCSHRSALKHHMLTHTGEKAYVCQTCGKRCGHASALQNHTRIHTGQKPGEQPICGVCGKYLSSMVNLKYHMRIHTQEKPHSCDWCGKAFRNPCNLRTHMVTHTGEKKYGCVICARRFTSSGGLKTHRRLHTGERYSCAVCGQRFLQPHVLKKHQMTCVPDLSG